MATAGTTLERASFTNLKYGRVNLKLLSTTGVVIGDSMTVTTAQGAVTGVVKKFIGSTSLKLGDLCLQSSVRYSSPSERFSRCLTTPPISKTSFTAKSVRILTIGATGNPANSSGEK